MVILDAAGLAIASADAVVRIIAAWKRRRSACAQIRHLLEDSQKRVLRMQSMAEKYGSEVIQSSGIARKIFQRVAVDFDLIKDELEDLESRLRARSNFRIWLSSEDSVATLSIILARLVPLETHLEVLGMFVHTQGTTCYRIADLATKIDNLAVNNGMGLRETNQYRDRGGTSTPGGTSTQASASEADTINSFASDEESVRELYGGGTVDKVVADRWRLRKKIGEGSFAEVFVAADMETSEHVAIKFERRDAKRPRLHFENRLYKSLNQPGPWLTVGVPRRHFFGVNTEYSMLVIDLLGPSLEYRLNQCCRSMSLKSVLMIGMQALCRVEYIHGKNFIHRDLKPANLLMGRGDETSILFVIDFSIAKRYRDARTEQHIPYREGKRMIGTARYASINAHRGVEQSRRDDLEALGYVLVYLANGTLPWQGLMTADKEEKYEEIRCMKERMSIYDLCRDMPSQFLEYFVYVKRLMFEERPDYSYLRGLFKVAMDERGLIDDGVFDWMEVKGESVNFSTIAERSSDSVNFEQAVMWKAL